SECQIARPPAHCLNYVECTNRDSRERCFRSSSDNHVGKITANVAKRFTHRYGAAGATVRISGANPAKSKLNRDIRMGRATENLDSERGLNSAGALFQIPDVLIFGLADTTKGGAKTYPDAMLRFFAGIFELRVIEGELRRCDGELRITIEPFQTVRREKCLRIP